MHHLFILTVVSWNRWASSFCSSKNDSAAVEGTGQNNIRGIVVIDTSVNTSQLRCQRECLGSTHLKNRMMRMTLTIIVHFSTDITVRQQMQMQLTTTYRLLRQTKR